MPYVGNIPAESYAAFNVQYFTTSATDTYTLDRAVANELDIRLVINNVIQEPGSGKAYTAAGTTLTLSAATAGSDTMYCVYIGKAVQTVNPGAGSVGTTALADNAVTLGKMASGTDGNIISYDASGNPVAVATGSSGQVLTSAGAGAPPSFAAASGTTINNNADNRVITGSGTANTLEGEANLTFDGNEMTIQGTPVVVGTNSSAVLDLKNTASSADGTAVGIAFSTNTGGSANAHITAVQDASAKGTLNFGGYDGTSTRNIVMSVNAGTGCITTPLQPMFSAYASSSQSVSGYSGVDVDFGGEDFDVGSNFASSVFTAPVAGKYVFFVKLQVADSAGWIKPKLIPSGKQYSWFMNPGQDDMSPAWSQIVDMAANDTCKVTIVADDGSYTIVGASGSSYKQTTFSGYLLG